jgi:hypothetical protein
MSKYISVILTACIVFVAGCVSIPVKTPTQDIQQEELKQDVYFLAQPGLKGRKTGSWESPTVRRFLTQRFKQYGLVPWAQCKTYEQDFRFGTNVIGVLPGSDPNLAHEIVVVSAHYDHVGVQKWKVCPGACDNASSVAAMLEIAESLSLYETKPRRTICFAAFDAEEMGCLGSFAFTCRDDYDDSKIAAVINMDLLGRDMLDVVKQSLFVTGTENYARIEDEVSSACAQNGLKFIPIGSDLIGPVGDHIAFTSSRRPVLFFSSGINKDYHQPTDTADKLSFRKLKQESEVIKQTVLAIANRESQMLERYPAKITRQTADSFVYILEQISENRKTLKLDPNGIKIVDEIITQVKQFDPNAMTRDRLLSVERESIGKLLKQLNHYDKMLASYSEGFIEISKLYAINPEEITNICRRTARHYLTHDLSIFSKNEYTYCGNLPVTEKSWGLTKINEGKYFFGFYDAEISIRCNVSVLTGMSFQGGLSYKLTAMKGPLRSIINAAFLGNPNDDPNRFQGIMYVQFSHAEWRPKPDPQNNFAQRQESLCEALDTAIQEKFPDENASLGIHFCQDPNWLAADWIAESQPEKGRRNIFLMSQDAAKSNKIDKAEGEHLSIGTLQNSSMHVESRTDAIDFLIYRNTKTALSAIVDVIDDRTPYKTEPSLIDESDYPLRYHPIVSDSISKKEEKGKKYKDKTLGQIALERLKKITKKDFGSDKKAWKQWIGKYY